MGAGVATLAAGSLIAIAIPTLVVLVTSINSDRSLAFPPTGFSLKWYAELLRSDATRGALIRSLVVGAESVMLALLVAIPAALALFRYRMPLRSAITAYLALGFSTPLVVSGLAFLVVYTQLGLIGSVLTLSVALTVVNLPFMLFALAAAVAALEPAMEEAAATLGANKVQTFVFVTVPGLMPGIVTGALLMFVFAISEFLVSLIITTVENQTLPVVIFAGIRSGLSPVLAAAGGIYIVIALAVIVAITRFRTLEQFLYRND